MKNKGIQVAEWPQLKAPLLIAGFDGWGNALDISSGMAVYLIRKLNAHPFARINPDLFYRYDINRPEVNIDAGTLKSISPPGGSFYAARTASGGNDIVILEAGEPDLQWFRFTEELFSVCQEIGVTTIITLGSMYDNVVHTDRIISGIASDQDMISGLKEKNVVPVSYQGASAIHSAIHSEGVKHGFESISLWTHCPYYLQNTTHYGLMAHLGGLLASLGQFELDTDDLETRWRALEKQIEDLIENSVELQSMIKELRKAKVKGSWERMKKSAKGDKVIALKDFLPPT